MKWKNLSLLLLLLLMLTLPKAVLAATVVNINHETGNLSQYTSTVTNGGNLSVTTSAALAGTVYGMSCLIGNSGPEYGEKTVTTNTSGVVRARFYFDPNSYSGADGNNFFLLLLRNSGGTNIGIVSANWTPGGVRKIVSGIKNDSSVWTYTSSSAISNTVHYIEIKMTRATNGSSNDGTWQLWIDGTSVQTITGVSNYNMFNNFAAVRLGVNDFGTYGSLAGTVYFDELVVNDDGGLIGPVSTGFPASSKYKLEGYSLGNAGGGGIGSSNYSVAGNVGEVSSNQMVGNSYDLGAGLAFVRQANAPKAASFTNPGSYSDKLHLIIDRQGNPSDTIYAIAISPDNFATLYYVKNDHTIGTTLATGDYQNYELWGGGSGFDIIGLTANTTYSVKIKAMQGKYTETGYGPVATAATVAPALTFDIDVAPTDIQTDPPFIINLGDLNPGSLVTSNDHVWVSLTTNTANGGSVFVYGQNAGLKSATAGYTISTVSGDLSSLSTGFGAQGVGATQTSGGPFTIDVGYTGTGGVVGATDTLVRQIFLTAGPIVGGRASFVVKAKSDNNSPAAGDYTETLTVIAAANY